MPAPRVTSRLTPAKEHNTLSLGLLVQREMQGAVWREVGEPAGPIPDPERGTEEARSPNAKSNRASQG